MVGMYGDWAKQQPAPGAGNAERPKPDGADKFIVLAGDKAKLWRSGDAVSQRIRGPGVAPGPEGYIQQCFDEGAIGWPLAGNLNHDANFQRCNMAREHSGKMRRVRAADFSARRYARVGSEARRRR